MKKIFTLISMALMAIGVNAQGSYGLAVTTDDIPAGTKITSVENITMTYGDAGAAAFAAPVEDSKLQAICGATAYTKGNGTNGNADNGTIYYFEPTIAGTLTVAGVFNANKTVLVKLDNYSGEDVAFTAIDRDGAPVEVTEGKFADKLYGAVVFSVEAGKKYAVGLGGSKMGFYGFKFEATGGGGGGGTTEAEKWTASSLDLTTVTTAANTTATLKKVETVYNLPEGAQPEESTVKADAKTALELNDYTFTTSTTNVTLTGISTPNTGTNESDIWKFNGNDNVKLNAANLGDECLVEFDNQYVLAGNGNPSLEVYEYFFTNSDGDPVGPRYYETYWTDGCGSAPLKGCYYKFETKAAGELIIGFFLNKNLASNPLYIVDGSTNKLIAKDAIKIQAFRNNCNYETEKGSTTKLVSYTLSDDYLVQSDIMGADTNRPLYGYITIDVAANSSYYLFSPKSQMGVYGFQFKGGTSGINIQNATNTWNANAPMYNLSGQKVDKSYKGIVIQNGRKFMNK